MSYNLVDKTTGALTRVAGNVAAINAEDINYDNTDSGLIADDMQEATDEIYAAFAALGLSVVNGKVCQTVIKEV